MSNFAFLRPEWESLYRKTRRAEERVYTEPVSSAHYSRLALEEAVHQVYEIERLRYPYDTRLSTLLREEEFRLLPPSAVWRGIDGYTRKIGNSGAHYGGRVRPEEALTSLRYLYDFLKWLANLYSETQPDLPGAFDESLVPREAPSRRLLREQEAEFEQKQRELEARIEAMQARQRELEAEAAESKATLAAYEAERERERAAVAERKAHRRAKLPTEFNEAETRKHLIDMALREAGWTELRNGREMEYPVTGMPTSADNPRGNGRVDYVLWGDDGLPLALVEAKRTARHVDEGRHQAWLYANALEGMYGRRPIIFYTNGYETYLWDDTFYSAPRRVYGFFTKDDLLWRISQRRERADPRRAEVDTAIAGRPYQLEAIKRVAEVLVTDGTKGELRGHRRAALLVMATGSGKTRTAAALVDLMTRHAWVKRVLFLADRNALVTQALTRFGEFLPALSAIDLTKEAESDGTRLVFSTYPTMMNRIDGTRTEHGPLYGPGHFDLIIVDEAHRSVYNKYGAIFDYFDALLVGLTATPREQIDHNTYELFACPDNDPTFLYELKDAVSQGYLVNYRNIDVSTGFLREGIKYKDLSPEDKVKYEETFRDEETGLMPEQIDRAALNQWLFNRDTVNKILDALMERGLKIEGGDQIGRSIIFAANQHHARFIEECFLKRYPQYPSGFISAVYNGLSHAQSLIEDFCDEYQEKSPRIAVSVDMLDTGIDAPRVLNLVFFKLVRSYAKFWQMIGRGTRLCPDVYGPDQPKEYFLIFDAGQNFDFFSIEERGHEGGKVKTLTQQLFEARLELARKLAETGAPEHIALAGELFTWLHARIADLDRERFEVKMHRREVDEFSRAERWLNLGADDVLRIKTHLAHLPPPEPVHETARRFDLLMTRLQLARLLELGSAERMHQQLADIGEALSTKYAIPEVARRRDLIEWMRRPELQRKATAGRLEDVRREIRELLQYLDAQARLPVYSDFTDEAFAIAEPLPPVYPTNSALYRRRVEEFIREQAHHLTVAKLRTNQPITAAELTELQRLVFDGGERGTFEQFRAAHGDEPLGKFIRRIVGLDAKAANDLFAEFSQAGPLTAAQHRFIQIIIDHLTHNGTIDKRLLRERPFTDLSDQGIFGLFDDAQVMRIVHLIDEVNGNAEVG